MWGKSCACIQMPPVSVIWAFQRPQYLYTCVEIFHACAGFLCNCSQSASESCACGNTLPPGIDVTICDKAQAQEAVGPRPRPVKFLLWHG